MKQRLIAKINIMEQEKLSGFPVIIGFALLFFAFTSQDPKQATEPWKTPASADTIKCPISFTAENLKKGEELYLLYCVSCHGETGAGDGPAGAQLVIKPANYKDEKVRKQSDGAIFWKITNGRGNMIAFKEVLKPEERWQLVSFIRKLSTQK